MEIQRFGLEDECEKARGNEVGNWDLVSETVPPKMWRADGFYK